MKDFYKKMNWLMVLLAVVSSLGLILIFLFINQNPWQQGLTELIENVIPDLVAVLIAVPIIYFLFRARGISPQEELKQGIVSEIIKLNNYNNQFDSEETINSNFNLHEKLPDAQSLCFLALAGYNFLSEFRPKITEAVRKGCSIRIMIVNPWSKASEIIMDHQGQRELEADLKRTKARIEQINQELSSGKVKGKFEVRYTNWIPSCSLVILNEKQLDGLMRLKIYPLDIDLPLTQLKTHTIFSRRINPSLFESFLCQFNTLWQKAVLWNKD